MTDDIVKRLRSWSPLTCWHCGEWGCLNVAGHSIFCEGGCRCEEDHYDKKCPTPCIECGGDEVCACRCHTNYSIEAADEIERLRAQVAFLLPFAKADAELGATLGPHPNDEYDDCADCQWYEQSMELLQKIEAGEFG